MSFLKKGLEKLAHVCCTAKLFNSTLLLTVYVTCWNICFCIIGISSQEHQHERKNEEESFAKPNFGVEDILKKVQNLFYKFDSDSRL